MQPTIGITMCYDDGQLVRPGVKYDIIRREYGQQIRAAGAQPIFLDASIDPYAAAQLCDGIVLSGGADLDPRLYGGKPAPANSLEPAERTAWEQQLITACDKLHIPILGICYGAQLLNVHYGGTLYQDIPTEFKTDIPHEGGVHEVEFTGRFMNFPAGATAVVNSRHHQAVRRLAPGFKVMARSKDGVIEAIAGRGHYGVQWHAEADATAPQIYAAFVRACSRRYLPQAWAKSWHQVRSRTTESFKKNRAKDL